jgi:apolipoprotein N-acyltransferase
MTPTMLISQVAWFDQHAAPPRVRTDWRAALSSLALCSASGVALAVAHEYEWLFALALVAIAVFLGAVSAARRRGFGFVLGLAFGLSCFGAGLTWLFNLLDQGEAPIAAALLPALLICALSAPSAIVGASLAGSRGGRVRRVLLVAPAVLVGFDWLRHQGDLAFPWFSVGYSQVAVSPLAGYAPIGGVLLVGFMAVLTAALLVVATVYRDLRVRAVLAAAALLVVGATLQHVPWTMPAGTPLRVAVLQGNVGSASKFDPAALKHTLARYEALIRSSDADVMLLPESALPVPAQALRGYLVEMRRHAQSRGTDILVGTFEVDPETDRRYSSALNVGPSGAQVYRKRQLVPFGDFVPGAAALYRTIQHVPFANTARGAAAQELPVLAGGRVAVAICYDDAFGERMRADAAAAGWIANLGNDSWGGSRALQRQHARMAQARALEFGRPQLRAADTGRSGLIDERGRWVDSLPFNEVGALEARIVPRSGTTPYAKWGDRAALMTCVLALLAAAASRGSAAGSGI